MDENKRDRFLRLAAKRTNSILKKIRVLGNCANRNYYEYTEEDLRKIFAAIEKQLQAVKSKFQPSGEREFKL